MHELGNTEKSVLRSSSEIRVPINFATNARMKNPRKSVRRSISQVRVPMNLPSDKI